MYIPDSLDDLISYKDELPVTRRKLNNSVLIHDVKSDSTIKIPYNSIINKYREAFDPYIVRIELTEEEQRKYRFNPRRMSNDLYNTVEYWEILLYINEMSSCIEFDKQYVNVVYPNNIRDIINDILIIQSKN